MSKLIIQSERCIACGKCYLNYPQVFDCEDDGIAFVQEDATEQDQKMARSAKKKNTAGINPGLSIAYW